MIKIAFEHRMCQINPAACLKNSQGVLIFEDQL
jgi:hypothetical protein